MEDFYWLDDNVGGFANGAGKIDINGKEVNFDFDAYGACYTVNIDGTLYPEFCGGPGDWTYRGGGIAQKGRPQPGDPSLQIVERIEQLRQMPAEALEDDSVAQIATQIKGGELEDVDEFELEGTAEFFHVINGRKVRMPDDAVPNDYIKELPVTKNLQPRDRWGDED